MVRDELEEGSVHFGTVRTIEPPRCESQGMTSSARREMRYPHGMIHSLGAHATGLRLERMRASPRYADGAFRNTSQVVPGMKKGTAAPTISEFLCGGQRRTPRGPLPSMNPSPSWSRPPATPLRATSLG